MFHFRVREFNSAVEGLFNDPSRLCSVAEVSTTFFDISHVSDALAQELTLWISEFFFSPLHNFRLTCAHAHVGKFK